MNFRFDIQGLRAIAVIAVIFFHINLTYLPGGFVGVDVFFVISGFLMTNILLNDFNQHNKINLWKFYLARARRIIPALYVALFITLLISAIIYSFNDMLKAFDIGNAFSFISNIYFSKELPSYWDNNIYISPFLHTWSLSLEWQFYILYPILSIILLYCFKNKKFDTKLLILNIIIFIASLLTSKYYLHINNDKYAFYLLQSRAFELAIGGIVAVMIFKKYQFNLKNIYLNIISLIAFIVLLLCFFIDVKPLGFPAFGSLIPVVSTAILIFILTNNNLYGHKLLSNKIMVYIGNLSYSLYLYHFIIYIFTKYILNVYVLKHQFTIWIELLIVILTFIFAYLSYTFIEKPCKKLSVKYLLLLMLILALFPIIASIGTYKYNVYLNKVDILKQYHAYVAKNAILNPRAFVTQTNINITTSNMNALLIGDSHSADYSIGFTRFMSNKGFNPYSLTTSGCDILTPNIAGYNQDMQKCIDRYNTFINTIENNKFEYIFIGLYDSLLGMEHYYNFIDVVNKIQKTKIVIVGHHAPSIAERDAIIAVEQRDNNTLFGYKFAKIFPHNLTGELVDVSYVYDEYNKIMSKYPNVQLFDVRPYFKSYLLLDGTLIYRDYHHLNAYGREYFSKILNENFQLK